MARTIDERVVSASFETSKFQAGASSMLAGLDKLKKSMNFKNAGKGLDQLNASAGRLNLGHISNDLGKIHGQFKNMEVVGIAVMANLATSAVQAGTRLAKAFTFQPVIEGFHEYENQLKSVQTILANTKDQGTNLNDVNKALDQLNQYADKTIYNFGQMTKNIGTFTAAGVDLKTSVGSIKGIANLAALSGSSSQQASTAMYQLSQAIAAGRVSLQDWNSVVNAGMGGAVFQKALMRTAEAMGELKDGAVEIDKATGKATVNGKSFRESIMAKPGESSWLSGEVLTNTLKQFSGDLSKAELKAQGFSAAQIKAIQAQAKTALDAATKVKTFTQLVETTKEAIGSGWASTFEIILGDFKEAKKLWSGLAGVIGDFVGRQADARNKMLTQWKKLGGRDDLLDGLKNAFTAISRVMGAVSKGFRNIFPRTSGKELANFTKRFEEFTKKLIPSSETLRKIQVSARGFFAVLDIGKQIIGGVISVIGKLFGSVSGGSVGFLDITAAIGGWLFALDESLKKGGQIQRFFDRLGDILLVPVEMFRDLAGAIGVAMGSGGLGGMPPRFASLETVVESLQHIWDKFIDSLSGSSSLVDAVQQNISDAFSSIGNAMAEGVANADMDSVFKVLEVGLLAGIGVMVHKLFSGKAANALTGGALGSLAKALDSFGGLGQAGIGVLEGYTGKMKAMQREVQSKALLNLAIAIALLAASLIGLSLVDPEKLNTAMVAITIAFGQLLGAMAILEKIGNSKGFIKMPIITASMILLALAINTLAIAVFALSRLSWEELAKGLGAVSVILIAISAASGPLSANAAGMIRAGTGIMIIAVAMNILAKAIESFGGMDMSTLAKGIGGIALALAGIGAAANLFPSGMVALGVGLVAIGYGLKLIAASVQTLGNLDMSTLGKGIGAIALALAGIGLAMRLMPGPAMLITAAGLLIVSVALGKIAKVVQAFGGMSIEEIAKGLGTLAGSLALLAIGLIAMSGTLGGATALIIAASGIAILTPALKSLGSQSWGQIIKGLVALGAAFVLIGVAGVALAPVAPAILALGAALIAVGAGLALAGAGVALIGIGLSAVAVAGPVAVKILIDALVQLAQAMPKVVKGWVEALVAMGREIAKAAPKLVASFGKILAELSKAIIIAAPMIAKAFVALLDMVFKVLRQETPNLVRTGFEMLKALLKGIAKNISGVVKMVATIVAKFLGAIASNLGKLISAGANILVAILRGIANNITKVATAAASIITSFLRGISNNIRKVAAAGVNVITKWLGAIADGGPKIIRAGVNVIVKLVEGIADAGRRIVRAGVTAATRFVNSLAREIPRLVDNVASAVITMLNRLAPIVRKRTPEFIEALFNIGIAIVEGIIDGMGDLPGKLLDKVEEGVKSLPKKTIKKILAGMAAVLKPPEGLGSAFGVTFTDTVISHLGLFEDKFQSELARIGGAENIEFLFNLGNTLGTSFYNGLLSGIDRGEIDPIVQAELDMADQIANSITETENAILEAHKKLKDANRALDNDYAARRKAKKINDKQDRRDRINRINEDIKDQKKLQEEARDTLEAQNQLLNRLVDTNTYLHTSQIYKDDIVRLRAAKDEVNRLNTELEEQTAILEDLKQKRQSLFDDKFKEFGSVPGIVAEDEHGNKIDPATQVNDYITSLSNADDVVGHFSNTMDQLAGMNLNRSTYEQLLDIGPAAQGFADALLKMGPGAVAAINAADTDLKNAARTMADHAAGYMYDESIKISDGLINGLTDGLKVRLKNAIKAAEDIATAIVKAIRRKLRMKSPSQVFAEIGAYSVEGMAQGMSASSGMVVDAIYGVSDDAKAAIKNSMRGISDLVANEINTDPVITPVLDLSQIQAGVGQIGSILPATASISLASGISVPGVGENPSETGQAAAIQFNQYNNSPESLSEIEIYRRTKNQLSQARPVLATS